MAITMDGTQNDTTVVSIDVERAVAKLVENTTNNTFKVENTLGASSVSAAFVNYAYNNLNKRYYAIKRVEQRSDAKAIAGNYVVDPNFIESDYFASFPAAPWYGNDFFTIGNEDVTKSITTAQDITYTLENTMISNEQYTNKSTLVVYKAQLTVDGNAGTFYTYKSRIYTSYDDLETVYNTDYPAIDNALAQLFTETEVTDVYENSGSNYSANVLAFNEKLKEQGIRCYYDGICYYNWPIKHWEQDVILGRMELGVVHNNVYYLEVIIASGPALNPMMELGNEYANNLRMGLPQFIDMANDPSGTFSMPVWDFMNSDLTKDRNLSITQDTKVYIVETNDSRLVIDPYETGTFVEIAEITAVNVSGSNNDYVTFTISSDIPFLPEEGYAYTVEFHFKQVPKPNEGEVCDGTARFTIKIVPEYLTWTGKEGDNWNNDNNWRRSLQSELYKPDYTDDPDSYGFMPMDFSKVTILSSL